MNYERLTQNLISVIKEAQIKLGYERVAIGVNYVTSSLIHLLGENADGENMQETLLVFARNNKALFGEIDIKKTENGFCLTVPPEGADYVHSLIKPDEFLVKFINEVRKPMVSIEDIISVFEEYSDKVVVKKTVENPEFDYVIYFENGEPDAFWYCIDTEDLGATYHRFTMEDYIDFGF